MRYAGIAITRTIEVLFALSLILTCGFAHALAGASKPDVSTATSALPLRDRSIVGALHALVGAQIAAGNVETDSSVRTRALVGQSVTVLSDGRVLLLGGEKDDQPTSTAFIKDASTGQITQLGNGLNVPRYSHTATVLPNGTVLILGGLGANGNPVSTNEIFDPSTLQFTQVRTPALTARAFHTATLLIDGRVLIAGGMVSAGQVTGAIEYWDYKTGTAIRSFAALQIPRGAHTATLQANGSVLFWGGIGPDGRTLNSGETFDPATENLQSQSTAPPVDGAASPTVAASIPTDGAQNVAIDSLIALRFSRPLRVQTLSAQDVSLSGPNGTIPIRVIPAEGGMLAFISPQTSLIPAARYELSVFDGADASGKRLPDTVIRFTTVDYGITSAAAAASSAAASQSNPFESPFRKLPPLRAPKGVTAVSGQVLQLDGQPLPNTTLQIGDLSARTDNTGRFLLEKVPTGHQSMWIDGTTANHAGMTYGLYEDGVDIKAGETSVLPYTIWMTVLDTADEVTIPSPTDRETIVSTPVLPGLELHIPAGTVIRDRNDQVVTKVGITLIPVSQPPFPLPAGVKVPTYFTIQPGGAYLESSSGGNTWSVGARLFYPNVENLPPHSLFDFWNYDADTKGWFIYGQGFVTEDRKQVVPNPGVEIYEFSGAMVGGPWGPGTGPAGGGGGGGGAGGGNGGDPVDLQTGLFVYTKTDLALSDVVPIEVTRTYRQMDSNIHAFGVGTMSNYDIYLTGDGSSYSYMNLFLANGGQILFDRISSGTGYTNAVLQSTSQPGTYYGAQISWNGTGWTLALKNGTKLLFPESSGATAPLQAALIGTVDRNGNQVTLTRDSNHNLTRVTSPNGRWIQYTYDSNNRVIQASDSIGRNVYYTYDISSNLQTVQDANGGTTTFTYDSSSNMQTIKDPRGIVYLTNYYDTNNMVSRQVLADGGAYQFSYVQNSGLTAPTLTNSQATVIDPRGNSRVVGFNSDGYLIAETRAVGKPEQQTLQYTRQAGSGQILSVTDALNRVASYTYDSFGNVTSTTALSGTPNAMTTSITYNQFGEVNSVTDALGRTTTLTYDNNGNLISITGTDGNSSSIAYNKAGQPVSSTDPLGNTTQVSYSGPDVSAVTDSLSRSTSRFTDEAGRLGQVANSGLNVQPAFNALNQIISITDSLGGVTSMVYDPNGNLTSYTDARNTQYPTKFVYDNMDRLQTRTDPLGNSDSRQYDGNGNLTQFTDRNGNITTYQYDALNRLTFVGFGTQPGPTYQSTISYTWDAGYRVNQVADSIAGTTTLGYDDLNRLTSISSPQGRVSYTYDAVGRRQSMTVIGQQQINYSYDPGNRVTQISQGSAVVQIGYDADGRRTSLTLPNALVANYSYDAGSQLTGIKYAQGGSVLGDLQYIYDAGGRVATVGGSLAHTGLPQPVSNFAYNAANQLTQFGTAQLTYDVNGNLSGDGAHTYSWDARNNLIAIDGGNTASFVYDPFGRRISKTIYGITTGYLYDGSNVVQELSGSSPSANLLSGGVDEVFARTDSTGSYSFLRDGRGSTSALTDSTGAIQQSYTYDAYGNSSTSGNASSNSYEYIGRETDATGLNYFRARYFNPVTQTFLSQDPLGLGGGPNLYKYAAGNPTTYRDPSGRFVEGCLVGMAGYEFGQAVQGLAGRKMNKGWNEAKGLAGACAIGFATEGIGEWAAAFADALEALGPAAAEAEEAATTADAVGNSVRFSQTSINNVGDIVDSMTENGWQGDPIDVVQMQDGGLTTVDNTRLFAANYTNTPVEIDIHAFDEPLDLENSGRFGDSETWGDAVQYRISQQNSGFRTTYPSGSPWVGIGLW